MNLKEFKGREVLGLSKLAGEFDYATDSKMAGKKYNRFAIDGKVFTVETNDPFIKAQEDGEVYSLKFQLNDEGQLSLASYTTLTGEYKMAEFEAKIERLKTIGSKPSVSVADEETIA